MLKSNFRNREKLTFCDGNKSLGNSFRKWGKWVTTICKRYKSNKQERDGISTIYEVEVEVKIVFSQKLQILRIPMQ